MIFGRSGGVKHYPKLHNRFGGPILADFDKILKTPLCGAIDFVLSDDYLKSCGNNLAIAMRKREKNAC